MISKKKIFKNFFQPISKRGILKRSSQIFREVSGVFQHNFKGSKIVLFSSRGQANLRLRELEALRTRTSKCVLETKDVLENSTSPLYHWNLEQVMKAMTSIFVTVLRILLLKNPGKLLQYAVPLESQLRGRIISTA